MHASEKLCPFLIVAIGLALAFPVRSNPPTQEDAFLDQKLPAGIKLAPISVLSVDGKERNLELPFVKITSYPEALALMVEITGKKVVFPAAIDLARWPREPAERSRFVSFGQTKDEKVGELFNRLCLSLGLVWHDNTLHDAILLDLQWQRKDPRPGEELAQVLVDTKPLRWDRLPWSQTPNIVGGHNQELDAWRIAFDALLSRSENFSSAGALRLYHDSHGHGPGVGPFPVINLFAGKMRGENGRPEILILNGQEGMSNKDDPGDLGYYLFDENGRFLKGGVLQMAEGRQGMILKIYADNDQRVTVDIGWGSFAMNPGHLHFTLANDDLVLQGSTDFHGQIRTAAETQSNFPFPLPGHDLVQLNTPC